MERRNWFTTKAVAYYNLGVEYEHLALLHEAVYAYGRALEIAHEELGEDSPLTTSIQESKAKAEAKSTARENAHYSRMISRRENNTHSLFNDSLHIKNVENTLHMRKAPAPVPDAPTPFRSPYRIENLKMLGP